MKVLIRSFFFGMVLLAPLWSTARTLETVPPSSPGAAKEKVFCRLILEKQEVFVNEVAPLSIKLFVKGPLPKEITYPQFSHENIWVGEFGRPFQREETIDGDQLHTVEFKTTFFGKKPGDFELGPVEMSCVLPASQEAGEKRMNYFEASESEPFTAISQVPSLRVLPFPEGGRPAGFTGAKVYEQILVPQMDTVTTIPEISFSFFDPSSKEYRILREGPIPIRVTKVLTDGSEASKTNPEKKEFFAYVAGSLLVSFGLLMLVAFSLYGRRITGTQGRGWKKLEEALAQAERSLREEGSEVFYSTISKVLQIYLGEKYGMPPQGITTGTVDELLKRGDLNEDRAGRVKEVFETCDLAPIKRQDTDSLPAAEGKWSRYFRR